MIERRGPAMYSINSITVSHHVVIAHSLGLCFQAGCAAARHDLRWSAYDAPLG
jgi:hypothetical protein